MPSWGIHLSVANSVLKEIEKNKKLTDEEKNQFLFGNILPDVNTGYVLSGVSNIISHKDTHFELKEFKGVYESNPGYKNFYEKYRNQFENPVLLGYYTHLMADYYFNTNTYSKYTLFNEDNKKIGVKLNDGSCIFTNGDEQRRLKANDFKIFSYYLYENNKVQVPKYDEKIVCLAQDLSDLNLIDNDVKIATNYIENCSQKPEFVYKMIEEQDYKLYTKDELKNTEQKCIDFIVKNLEENVWNKGE